MLGHLNRFTKDFKNQILQLKKKLPKLPLIKQYKEDFVILKKIQPKNPQDILEKRYLLSKLAYILYDSFYFEQNITKWDSFNNYSKDSGEMIWYLMYLFFTIPNPFP